MALKPITRQEQIIAGKNLEPITRMERFLKEYGGGTGGSVQSDWNQNDETAADFIKNKPFGNKEVVLLEEQTFTPIEEGNDFPLNWRPATGDVATVEFDGEAYELEVIDFSGLPFVGNGVFQGLDDTGEPFGVLWTPEALVVMSMDVSANHTIFIKCAYAQKIPAKYSDNITKVYVPLINPSAAPHIYLDVFMESAMTKADLESAMQKGVIVATQPGFGITVYVSVVIEEPEKDYAYIALCFGGNEYLFYTAEYTPET